ncbi:trichosurin-like [Monodelphis domestica]|uniref:Trichosurin-like n=1 Tax=Monodelphis domestica TaxID=13616 RepID=F7F0X2_MONDO|nr:trichosurin-like [Monodelphis domestica]
MKILVLIMELALICGLQADIKLGNIASQLTGEWFTIALGSNVTQKIEEGGSLRLFIKNIGEQNGIIKGTFFKRENGKCVQFSVSTKTEMGSPKQIEYDGLNEVSLQSIDSVHAIFVFHNSNNGKVTTWAELYGRTPDLPNEMKKKFEKICEKFGIRRDQIIDMSTDDRCSNLR